MKKSLIYLFLFLIVIGSVFYVKNKIGDIRPLVFPPKPLPTTPVNQFPSLLATPSSPSSVRELINSPLKLAGGFKIGIFKDGLGKPRDLQFTPDGTLLSSIPSSGTIVALPDRNLDGEADEVVDVLTKLDNPHGLAFYKGKLFVAEETKVTRYNFDEENLKATIEKKLFDLPAGGRHFTRSLVFNDKGELFVTIGSTCDVCLENHPWLAAIIKSDSEGNDPQLFAKGLRNAVFITINPQTQIPWVTEMGRDFLGDNLPPDEINIIEEGPSTSLRIKNYGWPICYGNKIHDSNFDKLQYIQDPCLNTQSPIFEIIAHSAPLGLTFINSPQFPDNWQGDLLVAYHGSWNRSTPIGYKVVRLDVEDDKVLGSSDFLTGFLDGSQTYGRPVDLEFDKMGSLYISDDKAGTIYKIIHT